MAAPFRITWRLNGTATLEPSRGQGADGARPATPIDSISSQTGRVVGRAHGERADRGYCWAATYLVNAEPAYLSELGPSAA